MLGLCSAQLKGRAIILKSTQDQSYHLFPFYEEADVEGAKKIAEDNTTREWQN